MLQMMLVKIANFLGYTAQQYEDAWKKGESPSGEDAKWIKNVVLPVVNILDQFMVPLIIMVGVFGVVYGITLGVLYSRAESGEKRDEIKKRIINAVIGVVITLIVMIILKLISHNVFYIAEWVDTMAGKN